MQKGKLRAEDHEPEIEPFKFYLDSFRELGTCRLNTMAVGPIPFTAIVEYSKLYDVGDFDEFLYYIRVMDNTLLGLSSNKSATGKENSKPNATVNTGTKNSR